jgi:hypothetical protein
MFFYKQGVCMIFLSVFLSLMFFNALMQPSSASSPEEQNLTKKINSVSIPRVESSDDLTNSDLPDEPKSPKDEKLKKAKHHQRTKSFCGTPPE